ncbi:MAG: tetratricopeptide repeat protein, partial [Flavobacteriales bacterium]
MRHLILTVITLLLATLVMDAQPSNQTDKLRNEAFGLFDSKEFVEAYPLYSQLVSLFPQDGDLNFRFGVCTLYAGESKEDAIKHLNFAKKKKIDDPRLHYYLGRAYHLNYEFDLAITSYKRYQEKRNPKDKDVLPAQQGITMCSQGKNLLTNIKD